MNGTHDDPTIVLVGDVRISPEDARAVEVWNGRLWAFDCAFSNPLHAIRNIELHDQEIAFERKNTKRFLARCSASPKTCRTGAPPVTKTAPRCIR